MVSTRPKYNRSVIGKIATVDMPCQRGANITICAAVSSNGPLIGPYNTERLISFLGELYGRVVPGEERDGQTCM